MSLINQTPQRKWFKKNSRRGGKKHPRKSPDDYWLRLLELEVKNGLPDDCWLSGKHLHRHDWYAPLPMYSKNIMWLFHLSGFQKLLELAPNYSQIL